MDHQRVLRTSRRAKNAAGLHDTMREGLQLGMIVGAVTWSWLAGFDFVTGAPFRTFHLLGGVAGFTMVHFALCITYGVVIMSAVHGALREPTLIFALIFSSILFYAAFGMVTAMFANGPLGQDAWGKFFAGNVVAGVVTYVFVDRRHSLSGLYHDAEAHLKD